MLYTIDYQNKADAQIVSKSLFGSLWDHAQHVPVGIGRSQAFENDKVSHCYAST
jgi:hypothetical protein